MKMMMMKSCDRAMSATTNITTSCRAIYVLLMESTSVSTTGCIKYDFLDDLAIRRPSCFMLHAEHVDAKAWHDNDMTRW